MRSPGGCTGHLGCYGQRSSSPPSADIEPAKKVASVTPVCWVLPAGLQERRGKGEPAHGSCNHGSSVVGCFIPLRLWWLTVHAASPRLTSPASVKSRVDCKEASCPIALNSAERTRLHGRQHRVAPTLNKAP